MPAPETALAAAHAAVTELRELLAHHDIVLPDLRVDMAAVMSGVAGVQYGGSDADTAQRIIAALRGTATPPTTPRPRT